MVASRGMRHDERSALLLSHVLLLLPQDCHMPEMDGLEATRSIRSSEAMNSVAPVYITALTASAFDFEKDACLRAGMNHFLTKPVRPRDLNDLLKSMAKRQPLGQQA